MSAATSDRPPFTQSRGPSSVQNPSEPDSDIPKARKAAVVISSLDPPLAARVLALLDRPVVEAITIEIARLGAIDQAERLAALEEFHELALRRLQFSFDDLGRMTDSALQTAFDEEDLAVWALALAGAAPSIRQKVCQALGPALAWRLERALENLGPFRLSDSEAAQHEIAEHLRVLHDRGRIDLPEPAAREEAVA